MCVRACVVSPLFSVFSAARCSACEGARLVSFFVFRFLFVKLFWLFVKIVLFDQTSFGKCTHAVARNRIPPSICNELADVETATTVFQLDLHCRDANGWSAFGEGDDVSLVVKQSSLSAPLYDSAHDLSLSAVQTRVGLFGSRTFDAPLTPASLALFDGLAPGAVVGCVRSLCRIVAEQ